MTAKHFHCAIIFAACVCPNFLCAEEMKVTTLRGMSIEEIQKTYKDAVIKEQDNIKDGIAYVTSIPSMGIDVLYDYSKRQIGIRLAGSRPENRICYASSEFYLGMTFREAKERPSLKKALQPADTGVKLFDDDSTEPEPAAPYNGSVLDVPAVGLALEFDRRHILIGIRLLSVPSLSKIDLGLGEFKAGMTLDEIQKKIDDKSLRVKTIEMPDLESTDQKPKDRYLLQTGKKFFIFDEKRKLLRVEQDSQTQRP